MKWGTETNLNMLNSMVTFHFSFLDGEYPFWANFAKKRQNYLIMMNPGTWTNSNMLN